MDTSKLAIDSQGPGLRVSFSWAPKKRELFLVVPNTALYGLGRSINVRDLHEDPLRHMANLLTSGDKMDGLEIERKDRLVGNAHPKLPRFYVDILEAPSTGEGSFHTLLRFVPFLPQNVACVKSVYSCSECDFFFPCSMSLVPLGWFIPLDTPPFPSQTRRPGGQCHMYDFLFWGVPECLYGNLEDTWTLAELDNEMTGIPLYGYPGLFTDFPEIKDCFLLQKPKRR